jgi:hypothetical protein
MFSITHFLPDQMQLVHQQGETQITTLASIFDELPLLMVQDEQPLKCLKLLSKQQLGFSQEENHLSKKLSGICE